MDSCIDNMAAELSFVNVGNIFLLGLFYGFTVCSISCFPLLATYIIATKDSFKGGFYSCIVFFVARLLGYITVGILSAIGGIALQHYINQNILYGIAGVIFIWIGIELLWRAKPRCCSKSCQRKFSNNWQVFTFGYITGVTPCLPYMGVMSLVASSGSITFGVIATTAFGIGNMISPLLILSGGLGWLVGMIAEKTAKFPNLLRKVNGVFVMLMGCFYLLNFIAQIIFTTSP